METINDVFSPELLDKVFAYLSLSDQANAIQVCRLWHDVVWARLNVMKYLELSDASKEDVVKQLVRLEGSNVFRGLRDLYVKQWPNNYHDIGRLVDSLISGGGLTKLHVCVPELGVKHVLGDLFGDKRISVHNFSPDAQLHCLEHLQITSKHQTIEKLLVPVVEKLVSVVLKNVPTNLKVIILRGVKIGSKVEELVGSSPRLHTLMLQLAVDCAGWQKMNDIIAKISNLEVLDLRGSNVVTTSELVKAISGLTRLTFVGMSSMITATSKDFSNLAKCPKLKSILTGRYTVVSVDSICKIKYFTFIHVLEASLKTEQQLRTLSDTVASCKVQVCQLDVSQSSEVITDELLRSLVVACGEAGQLHRINANGCHQLTNQGVVNVISAYKPSINSCVAEWLCKPPSSADSLNVEGIGALNRTLLKLLNDMPGPPRTKRLIVSTLNSKMSEEMTDFPDDGIDCGLSDMIYVRWYNEYDDDTY